MTMNRYNRKKVIELLKESDKIMLLAGESEKIDYSVKTDDEVMIELICTLQLANNNLRFLYNRVEQLTNIKR